MSLLRDMYGDNGSHNRVPWSNSSRVQTHQTKYHRTTLETLAKRFSQIKDFESASETDREMWKYLASVHNNLNKGIKGCGGRRIRRVPQTSSAESSPPSTPASVVSFMNNQYEPFTGHLQPFQQIPPLHHGFGHPSVYSFHRQNITVQANIHMDIRMYESDNDSMKSNAASPTSTATYDPEQEQVAVLGHRLF